MNAKYKPYATGGILDSRITTLDNGLRVVSINLPHVASVTAATFVNVGSRFESEELGGISHFLEHMAFKGTTTRSCEQILSDVEFLGAEVNAYTSKDRTAYYISGLAENTEFFLDMISDVLKNSTFPPEEIERERGAILQEIISYKDSIRNETREAHDLVMFPDQPLGRPILGTPENVKSFTQAQLQAYMTKHYTASNMIVGVVGRVDHDQIAAYAQKYFGDIERGETNVHSTAEYHGGFNATDGGFEQSMILMSWPSADAHDMNRYADAVLASVLGDGMSSPLFTEVREKRGLVYSIYSFTYIDTDNGAFYVGAGSTPENFDELFSLTIDELKKACDQISERDFQRAKNQLRVAAMRSREKSFGLLTDVVENHFVYGRSPDLEEILTNFEAVTLDDVKAAMRRILSHKPTLTMSGPGGDEKYYTRLVERVQSV